jgi:predicted RNA-binding protein with PUA-like domain
MHWLLKTEPSTYNYARLEKERRSVWDGVTNAFALQHLRSAKKGELAIVYHTGGERAAVGVAEIVSDPYPDPSDDKLTVLDIAPRARLKQPVTLAAIKASPLFADSLLVRQGRLSVVPLDPAQWKWLMATSKTKL